MAAPPEPSPIRPVDCPVYLPLLKNSMSVIIAGPKITTMMAGKMKSSIGKSSLTGVLAAAASSL